MTGPFSCAADADCKLTGLHCLVMAGQPGVCVECLGDGQCPSTAHRCDPSSNRCVECLTATDCPVSSLPGEETKPSSCTATGHHCLLGCDDSSPTVTCPTTRNFTCAGSGVDLCVECRSNGDCSGSSNGSICSENLCVRCTATSGSCASGQSCDAVTGRCVECLSSRDCHNTALPLCSPTTLTCVALPP
jgi:hypothetical protein